MFVDTGLASKSARRIHLSLQQVKLQSFRIATTIFCQQKNFVKTAVKQAMIIGRPLQVTPNSFALATILGGF